MNSEAVLKNENSSKGADAKKIANRTWDVVKGLVISVATVVLIIDSVMVYWLYSWMKAEHTNIELDMPYYTQTQDYLDLAAMYEKAPDSAEYKAMLKAFNTKYSVPYTDSQVYIDLAKAHKENPNSEEYKQLLEKFLEQFDIPVENISFDE